MAATWQTLNDALIHASGMHTRCAGLFLKHPDTKSHVHAATRAGSVVQHPPTATTSVTSTNGRYPNNDSLVHAGLALPAEADMLSRSECPAELCFNWAAELVRSQEQDHPERMGAL
jgi:hypothetical protein